MREDSQKCITKFLVKEWMWSILYVRKELASELVTASSFVVFKRRPPARSEKRFDQCLKKEKRFVSSKFVFSDAFGKNPHKSTKIEFMRAQINSERYTGDAW
ncbi:MAG TPA: hypothetical protein VF598_07910 [Hymenobacter sp.]|jgi:hypothetical protein